MAKPQNLPMCAKSLATWAFALLLPSVSWAGSAAGNFQVTVNLIHPLDGLCISSALSQQTQALVKVTCQGEQFVSIEPREGRPFLGTHGGAYRFVFNKNTQMLGSTSASEVLEDRIGQGTITSLRVLDLTETDERLELLVSF